METYFSIVFQMRDIIVFDNFTNVSAPYYQYTPFAGIKPTTFTLKQCPLDRFGGDDVLKATVNISSIAWCTKEYMNVTLQGMPVNRRRQYLSLDIVPCKQAILDTQIPGAVCKSSDEI